MKPTPRIPVCHLIAGPNGAGKSTFALEHLPALAKCTEFINADLIAAGLSPLDPTRSALRAGRLVFERIKEIGLAKKTFGFESTLSGRGYLSTLTKLKKRGLPRSALLPLAAIAQGRHRPRQRTSEARRAPRSLNRHPS
jgi:predicted ABC-type ATPase